MIQDGKTSTFDNHFNSTFHWIHFHGIGCNSGSSDIFRQSEGLGTKISRGWEGKEDILKEENARKKREQKSDVFKVESFLKKKHKELEGVCLN